MLLVWTLVAFKRMVSAECAHCDKMKQYKSKPAKYDTSE